MRLPSAGTVYTGGIIAGVVVGLFFFCYFLWQDGNMQQRASDARCALAFRAASTPAESIAVIDKRTSCAYSLARSQQVPR